MVDQKLLKHPEGARLADDAVQAVLRHSSGTEDIAFKKALLKRLLQDHPRVQIAVNGGKKTLYWSLRNIAKAEEALDELIGASRQLKVIGGPDDERKTVQERIAVIFGQENVADNLTADSFSRSFVFELPADGHDLNSIIEESGRLAIGAKENEVSAAFAAGDTALPVESDIRTIGVFLRRNAGKAITVKTEPNADSAKSKLAALNLLNEIHDRFASEGARLARAEEKLAKISMAGKITIGIHVPDAGAFHKIYSQLDDSVSVRRLYDDDDLREFTEARPAETRLVIDETTDIPELLRMLQERESVEVIDYDDVLTAAAAVLEGGGAALDLPVIGPNRLIIRRNGVLWIRSAAGRIITPDHLMAIAEARPEARAEFIDAFVQDYIASTPAQRQAALDNVSSRFTNGIFTTELLKESKVKGRFLLATIQDGENEFLRFQVDHLRRQAEELNREYGKYGMDVDTGAFRTLEELKAAAAKTSRKPIVLSRGDWKGRDPLSDDPTVLEVDRRAKTIDGTAAVAVRLLVADGKENIGIAGLTKRGEKIWHLVPIRALIAGILREAILREETVDVSA